MKKEKSIETKELLIKGNIISWVGTMIQLSNVSCISTVPLALMEFPKMSLLLLVIGLFFLKYNAILGIILIAGGSGWIYVWYRINEARKSDTILNITMNSGNDLRILFSDKQFLNEVLQVLEKIIIEGGVGEKNISINIRDCQISGNAKVLDDFKS